MTARYRDERCTFDGVLTNRDQLDRALAFANRILLVPSSGINDAKRAKRSRIVRLVLYRLRRASFRAFSNARCELPTRHHAPSGNDLAPAVREWNIFVKASTLTHVR